MRIESEGIINGKILDKYGKKGRDFRFGMPTLSLPLHIYDAPMGTRCYAIVMEDPDSVKVCGKVWIHWLVANLFTPDVEEDSSSNGAEYIQGINSWRDNSYGGPCPPDRPHTYVITCYALSEPLDLRGGFDKQMLEESMQGKVLDSATLLGVYDN